MPARAIFYDLTKDGSRLTGEWSQNVPANWSQQYSSPYQAYKYTNAGGVHYCTLMSVPETHDCEVNVLLKATNADAMMGVILRKARTVVQDAGMFYFWCTGGVFGLVFVETSGALPVLASVAYVVDTTKWHRLRIQANGRWARGKIWVDGTAEPDWMINYYIKYREMRNTGTIGLNTTVRDVYFSTVRYTPIPRTGGP